MPSHEIAVIDANIFIDLIKLQWLDYLFCINVEIFTTQEVADELRDSQLKELIVFSQSQKLTIYSFSSEQLEAIVKMTAPSSLSLQDKSVFFLAKHLRAGLLSGDNALRKFCIKHELEVKGAIWLFDEFLKFGLISKETAINKMNYLLSFNNRLPADCHSRLKEWQSK